MENIISFLSSPIGIPIFAYFLIGFFKAWYTFFMLFDSDVGYEWNGQKIDDLPGIFFLPAAIKVFFLWPFVRLKNIK